MEGLPVNALVAEPSLQLDVVAGEPGLSRLITVPRIQKPGLALSGYIAAVHPERVQLLGFAEITYLGTLDDVQRMRSVQGLCALEPSCLVVTRGLEVPDVLRIACEEHDVPLLRTPLMSSVFINRITKFMEGRLAPSTSIHGVLCDVFGIGILLVGKSGVGKSEAALELVLRGHRLVTDDVVDIRLRPPDTLFGGGADLIKHHMEIRGLGIINVKDLFGVAAVRDTKKIELVVELVDWDEEEEYDRLGLEEQRYPILGLEVPRLRIPIRPGRNIAAIIEVAARNQLLKVRGHHSAREFQERLTRAISEVRVATVRGDDVE